MSDSTEKSECFIAPTSQPKTEPESTPEEIDAKNIPNLQPKKKISNHKVNVPLPYTEPDWGGLPKPTFSFEIIKNGTLISTVTLRSSLLVFGRLETCDFVFEHPSVSRYHAVIQYCKGDDAHPKGFYLYDLGSTHGTFLNKEPVKSKIYYKLKVGYVLKFGGSSRLYIFQGPEEEEEDLEAKKPRDEKTEVCTWGIGDDSDAEEDDPEGVNPFAFSTANEELYLDDPKKTLKNWFEREGYEVEYDVTEKGFKSFSCTVRLPVDTPSGEFLAVEATNTGKKKEAVVACALEACRTLDRLGLLRQSHHESRQKKRKKWEENDYYDSDEDTFYDRTGEIEKRREMRKRLSKRNEKADNFESLSSKHKTLMNEIREIETKLSACAANASCGTKTTEEDSLETYMSDLAKVANAPTDKFEKRKLKLRLLEAEKEKRHLEKLLDIVRPASLPPVLKVPGFIGKRPKSKLQLPKTDIVKLKEAKKNEDNTVEEVESDSENNEEKAIKGPDLELKEEKTETKNKSKYGLHMPTKQDNLDMKSASNTEKTVETEDMLDVIQPIDSMDCSMDKSIDEKKFKNVSPSVKKPKNKTSKNPDKNIDVYETKVSDYVTWTPPVNQSGDGMTHLNAKYGY